MNNTGKSAISIQHYNQLKNENTLLKQLLEDQRKQLKIFETVLNFNPAIASISEAAGDWKYTYISEGIRQYGYEPKDFYSGKLTGKSIIHPDDIHRITEEDDRYVTGNISRYDLRYRIITKDGQIRWVIDRCRDIYDSSGTPIHTISTFLDITEIVEAEQTQKKLISELQKALNDVKKLQELIPICAHCKKIRNDDGYWQQLEEYFTTQSNVEFSHAFCPECMDKFYPEDNEDVL